jgi:N-acetylneuraminic acid mutarotase
MRKICLVTLLCVSYAISMQAQVNINTQWTWIGGSKHIPLKPVPGTKGVAAEDNTPSGRKDPVSWVDASGTVWMFGGTGHGTDGVGMLNDLWKYNNATNQWTWVSGSISINNAGVYGIQGVAADANMPGSRTGSCSWVGADGKLYLFGGNGSAASGSGWLNDLWKYDPSTNQWTWVNGPATANAQGVYGTEGVTAVGNRPGGRAGATIWKGNGSIIWMFGGDGFATSATAGRLSDLWKYDQSTDQWTWMRGANIINSNGGSSSGPEARNAGNTSWKDNAGNLYLFGGAKNGSFSLINPPCGDGCPAYALIGDFWRYNVAGNNWTQIGGALPSKRYHGLSWTDAAGNFWLSGGYGVNLSNPPNMGGFVVDAHLNDIWKFNTTTQVWTQISGDYGEQIPGAFNVMGVTSAANKKGGRASAVTWFDNTGKLYSFGGQVQELSPVTFRNDVWSYDPVTNLHTWLKGDTISTADPSYGQLAVAGPSNSPGERSGSGRWSDNNGNLWLFGGDMYKRLSSPPGYFAFDDLWKYNISSGQWAWMQGNGQGNPKPGPRQNMTTWTDNSNNLWLFGGEGYFSGTYNDLWKYVPASNAWTLMKGSASAYESGSTGASNGTQGVAAATNVPASRELAMNWKDNAGNLWIFGGMFRVSPRQYSDLWRFDVASGMWTWVKGSTAYNQYTSTVAQLGVADANNNPGARIAGASWTDNAGNFWMFGGEVTSTPTYSGDLWRFNPDTREWTCFAQTNNTTGVYGVKGTANAANRPGARSRMATWTDAYGNLWLMGGLGYDKNGATGRLNDVWMYNTATNLWTWVKGDDVVSTPGVYGTKGIPDPANKPGARYAASSWLDGVGDIWIYGGNGFDEAGFGPVPDMWKLASPSLGSLPVRLVEFRGRIVNSDGLLNWKTENEENASAYIVERSTDRKNYVSVGTIAANNTSGGHLYSFTDPGITSLNAPVLYYRLKQKDTDGRSAYSNIVALTIDKSFLVMLYPNPVDKTANITITTDRNETVNVKVINSTGAVIKQLQWKLTRGSRSESIDCSTLAKGTYYIELSGETILKNLRFVKQ